MLIYLHATNQHSRSNHLGDGPNQKKGIFTLSHPCVAVRDESDICMMIGKRVNANASTLVRLNLRQGLRP